MTWRNWIVLRSRLKEITTNCAKLKLIKKIAHKFAQKKELIISKLWAKVQSFEKKALPYI